jgi:hypothetical protein
MDGHISNGLKVVSCNMLFDKGGQSLIGHGFGALTMQLDIANQGSSTRLSFSSLLKYFSIVSILDSRNNQRGNNPHKYKNRDTFGT